MRFCLCSWQPNDDRVVLLNSCSNMNVHTEIMELARSLAHAGSKHHEVHPVLSAAFVFLATFVHRHSDNQVELWKHRGVIEASLGNDVCAELALAEAVFENRVVAASVDDNLFWHLIEQVEKHNKFDAHLLLPVIRSMKVEGVIMKKNQGRAMRVLLDARNVKVAALLSNVAAPTISEGKASSASHVVTSRLLRCVLGLSARAAPVSSYDDFTTEDDPLQDQNPTQMQEFGTALIRLFAIAAEGKNHMTETQCHSVVHESDIVHAIVTVDGVSRHGLKGQLLNLFLHAYVDVEKSVRTHHFDDNVWSVFDSVCRDILAAVNGGHADALNMLITSAVPCISVYMSDKMNLEHSKSRLESVKTLCLRLMSLWHAVASTHAKKALLTETIMTLSQVVGLPNDSR
jgi:hypothetical protein